MSRRNGNGSKAGGRSTRPGLEGLESRDLLAVLVVTSPLDSGPGTLREALIASNQSPGRDEIRFAIGEPGTQRISLGSGLPPIQDPVVIDGTSQPGTGPTPRIVIEGRGAPGASGLAVTAGDSVIKGLAIVGFPSNAIQIGGAGGNLITGNHLGVEPDGRSSNSNGDGGIQLNDSRNNSIVGNVISANLGQGILIGGPQASGNLIQGNIIGLDASGKSPLGNGTYGIQLSDSSGTTVLDNTVSANRGAGIQILTSNGNRIHGNRIGTDGTGDQPRSNYLDGIFLAESSNNSIGGPGAGQGNLISGNAKAGIAIYSPSPGQNSAGNLIQGNIIGLDARGEHRLGNLGSGILLTDSPGQLPGPDGGDPVPGYPTLPGNSIGGENPGEGNLISGNGSSGIVLFGPGTSGNTVWGNTIGTDATGTIAFGEDGFPLGNLKGGIFVSQAPSNSIGGATVARRNLISANLGNGIEIFGKGAIRNLIQGNDIGVNASGTGGLGNAEDGLNLNSAGQTTVGGATSAEANVILANGGNGIRLFSDASNNQVLGNRIGVARSETSVFGNLGDGLLIQGSAENLVRANFIADNKGNGVAITNRSSRNVVQANSIGKALNGLGEGNDGNGLELADSRANLIGGPDPSDGNVLIDNDQYGIRLAGGASLIAVLNNTIDSNHRAGISVRDSQSIFLGLPGLGPMSIPAEVPEVSGRSGLAIGNTIRSNDLSGIEIDVGVRDAVIGANQILNNAGSGILLGNQSEGTLVAGNTIGVASDGATAAPNQFGIRVSESPRNTLGGTSAAARNVVSGNATAGIVLDGIGARLNLIQGNRIGTNAAGTAAIANGIGIDAQSSGQNSIGGAGAGEGNLISGNTFYGIQLSGYDRSKPTSDFIGNIVRGNVIGPDVTGLKSLSTSGKGQQVGIIVNDSPNHTIGGVSAGQGNLISGNLDVGIYLASLNTTGNLVAGNVIGLDASGNAKLGNAVGIYANVAPQNSIGGSVSGAGNVISGNPTAGVYLFGELSSTRNGSLVQGNRIGTNAAGTKALGNGTGVYIQADPRNTVGGAGVAKNLISGNTTAGVYVFDSDDPSNIISDNFIGSDVTGKKNLGNGDYGVLLYNAASTTVNRTKSADNLLLPAQIAAFREFTGAVPATTTTTTSTSLSIPKLPGRFGTKKLRVKIPSTKNTHHVKKS